MERVPLVLTSKKKLLFLFRIRPGGGTVTRRALMVTVGIAVIARIIVFVLGALDPFTNELGMPVSPLTLQPWIEFEFYLKSLEMYRSLSVDELVGIFKEFYQRPAGEQFGHIIGGPVFPFMIAIFDYREGNTLPLAAFYLALSCLTCMVWQIWLSRRGVGLLWLLVFAVLPNPFWFLLNATTDLPFAFAFAAFYLLFGRSSRRIFEAVGWVSALIFSLLTRPNGVSLLLFVFLFQLWNSELGRRRSWLVLGLLGVSGLLSALYLYPYFITELIKVLNFPVFGIQVRDYLQGIYGGLPVGLNEVLSWLSLVGAKFLYFVGLRPSHSGIEWQWLFLRSGAGLILLPGLVLILLRGGRRDGLLAWAFFLPVFLGPTQDRYNLAIQPLLYYYGLLAYAGVVEFLRTSRWRIRSGRDPQ